MDKFHGDYLFTGKRKARRISGQLKKRRTSFMVRVKAVSNAGPSSFLLDSFHSAVTHGCSCQRDGADETFLSLPDGNENDVYCR